MSNKRSLFILELTFTHNAISSRIPKDDSVHEPSCTKYILIQWVCTPYAILMPETIDSLTILKIKYINIAIITASNHFKSV